MDFGMIEKGVLTFDFTLRKKSIGEVFTSYTDLTALNPIRRFEDSMAEFTVLLTFLFMLLSKFFI